MLYKELADARGFFHVKCQRCRACINACQAGDPKPVEAAMDIVFDQPADTDALWRCLNCYTCSYACPQNLDPRSLVYLARRLTTPPPNFQALVNLILNKGTVMELNSSVEELRELHGAIKLKVVEDVVRLLR